MRKVVITVQVTLVLEHLRVVVQPFAVALVVVDESVLHPYPLHKPDRGTVVAA
jgi:hypothetical protein